MAAMITRPRRSLSSGKAKAAQVPQPGSELKPEGREERWVKDGEKLANQESTKD